jgi:hypothetical protein
MTTESRNNGISDFALQVTQANNYQQLRSAFAIVSKEFDDIIKQDTKGKTTTFIRRYRILESIAKEILKKDSNNKIPSEKDLAVISEIVILRDICLQRLENAK